MCTSIAMKWGGGYFGRNMDVEYSFGEQVAVTPRRYPLRFWRQPDQEEHFALIGMAHVAGGRPLYAEAANEKGLYMAGLNFPGSAWYEPDPPAEWDAVAPYELIPWVLGSCATLAEAKERLARFRPLGVPLAAGLPLAPLHWHIADRTGALVLEATREGVRLYDDPVGVLTNNPPFPFHQLNLRQYQHLTARPTENRLAPGLPLETFGQGMGAIGLPGDASPASRYVRAAFCKLNAPDPGGELERVSDFFHLLDAVAMVRGSVLTPEGKWDMTTYACCFSAGAGTYYYKPHGNSRLSAVRLAGADLDGSTVQLFPLCREEDVRMLN